MRRLKLYYLFFHSTLKINVPLSILGALIVSKADWSLFWEAFPYLLGGWGIVALKRKPTFSIIIPEF